MYSSGEEFIEIVGARLGIVRLGESVDGEGELGTLAHIHLNFLT